MDVANCERRSFEKFVIDIVYSAKFRDCLHLVVDARRAAKRPKLMTTLHGATTIAMCGRRRCTAFTCRSCKNQDAKGRCQMQPWYTATLVPACPGLETALGNFIHLRKQLKKPVQAFIKRRCSRFQFPCEITLTLGDACVSHCCHLLACKAAQDIGRNNTSRSVTLGSWSCSRVPCSCSAARWLPFLTDRLIKSDSGLLRRRHDDGERRGCRHWSGRRLRQTVCGTSAREGRQGQSSWQGV